MSVYSIGGAGFNGYAYQPSAKSPDPAGGAGGLEQPGATANGSSAAVSLPGGNTLPGANALMALNGFDITGAVTATMPDGITFGIYSFAPHSEAGSASNSGSAGGSTASNASTPGPDYGAMEAALEQMVEQFMASGFGYTSHASTAAAQYAQQQNASGASNQQASGTVV